MRKLLTFPMALLTFVSLAVCNPVDEEPLLPDVPEQTEEPGSEENNGLGDNNNSENSDMGNNVIKMAVNGHSFMVTLVDNPATEALKARLAQGSLSIRLEDYGDMEKVGSLGFSLPRNDSRITTAPGDIILYQGNSIVLFYGTNTWSYTRLGHVDGVSTREQMLELLDGKGAITAILSLE